MTTPTIPLRVLVQVVEALAVARDSVDAADWLRVKNAHDLLEGYLSPILSQTVEATS